MENQQITGVAVRVSEVKSTSEGKYKYRTIHIKVDGEYPQTYEVEFQQGNTALLDNVPAGQKLTITANLQGREWENKEGTPLIFMKLVGWKIQKLS
jgi:hypothetical protein